MPKLHINPSLFMIYTVCHGILIIPNNNVWPLRRAIVVKMCSLTAMLSLSCTDINKNSFADVDNDLNFTVASKRALVT